MTARYQQPGVVPYIWTKIDQQVAQRSPPAWYKGATVVTPYFLDPSHITDAAKMDPGTTIHVDMSKSIYKRYVSAFLPRGYKWVKIPPNVAGATIEELCANLLVSDPSGSTFPAVYYDLKTPNKIWPNGVPIWRLLVDCWENMEYRYALVQGYDKDVWLNLSAKTVMVFGGKHMTHVLALDPTSSVVHAVTGGTVPRVVPAKLAPPKMKVGLNYPYGFNKYGLYLGPHPDEPWMDRWLDYLGPNLREAKRHWGVEHVRLFVMCNGFNYGQALSRGNQPNVLNPVSDVPLLRASNNWSFDPPSKLNQKFIDDFTKVLAVFKSEGCKLIPSLLDFQAFAPTAKAGKSDIATDPAKRKKFMDTVLNPFLDASMSYKDQIYAWEVMNEPSWTTRAFAKPIALDKGQYKNEKSKEDWEPSILRYAPDFAILKDEQLNAFLGDALDRIEARGFASTVGHRTYDDMSKYKTGTRKQFHFYAWPVLDAPGLGVAAKIPRYQGAGGLDDRDNTFVGEIGAGDDGASWPELNGVDKTDVRNRVFERLSLVAQRGYPLALLWPDLGWRVVGGQASTSPDPWKYSDEAILGLCDFTFGLFPGGVP